MQRAFFLILPKWQTTPQNRPISGFLQLQRRPGGRCTIFVMDAYLRGLSGAGGDAQNEQGRVPRLVQQWCVMGRVVRCSVAHKPTE